MKKNNILYLLIVVLIISNAFFVFNHLRKPDRKGPKAASKFIVTQLKFDDAQLEQFKVLEEKHHENIITIADKTKPLRDELFESFTAPTINQDSIDSLLASIYKNEVLKEKAVINRFRSIYELCNESQKEDFSAILEKARELDHKKHGKPNRPE